MVSLNIKNERTHALVRELAELTGMSQTSAVEDAVRRRLTALRSGDDLVERRVDEILQGLRAYQAELTDDDRDAIRRAQDDLYDESGLPR